MASARSLRSLYQLDSNGQADTTAVIRTPTVRASSGMPYDAASTGRRNIAWTPTRLGPTTSLWGTLDLMRARCRDETRNTPWAASAVDNFESQVVGNGIRPHWTLESADLKREIERKFNRWAEDNDFYATQATAAREIFEAGEVFVRYYVRPSSWNLSIPLQLQLIEGEQVPIFLNHANGGQPGTPFANSIRTGIEFDPDNRIVAYHMYKSHPGETMFYPMDGLQYIRVPADQIVHVFKRGRAGLLRGQPHMAAVLMRLHDLGKYSDAALFKKQLQTMLVGVITRPSPDSQEMLPTDLTATAALANDNSFPFPPPQVNLPFAPKVNVSRLEPGTFQELFPGEEIAFPNQPQDNDLEAVMRVWLHEFAVGVGATYEQITGDLKGVNLSSIRAGILDFRRKCEQFQRNVLISQLIRPIVRRWLYEAVLAGELRLPGYERDRSVYEDISYSTPGWPWIDPVKDAQAKQAEVRSGFTSREAVVAERGEDVAIVDAQQVTDNARADALGLVYDIDPRKVLIGRESNPDLPEPQQPDEEEVGEEQQEAGAGQQTAAAAVVHKPNGRVQ